MSVDDSGDLGVVITENDEIHVDTYITDLDSDSFDDQIIAAQQGVFGEIFVTVKTYDSETGNYEALPPLSTGVTQSNSFSLMVLDLLGNHSKSIVTSGYDRDGNTVLNAFLVEMAFGKAGIKLIANVSASENVTVLQSERSQNYQLEQSNGKSFPIMAFSATENPTEQLCIEYDWSAFLRRYIKRSEKKIKVKKVNDDIMKKLHVGTVSDLEKYLDGLWYKIDEKEGSLYFVFFNSKKREIIFLFDEAQEIYRWRQSSKRREGLYFSVTNTAIPNLTRRVDVSMSVAEEIVLRINDDVRMPISENTIWNGTYRRHTDDSVRKETEMRIPTEEFEGTVAEKKLWKSSDGVVLSLCDNKFEVGGTVPPGKGVVAYESVKKSMFFQFRPDGETAFLKGFYKAELSGEGRERQLMLSPAIVTSVGYSLTGDAPLLFNLSE